MIRQYLSDLSYILSVRLCIHESALPNVAKGRYRLICSECGWMSVGWRI